MTAAASRLDLPPAAEWTPEQRVAAERIAAGPRGALLGPFVPLLHAPELMTRLQLVGEHLRFATVLDADVFELAVLTVARYWDQPFEWGFHQPLAVRAGVPESVVEEIGTGTRPSAGRPLLAQVREELGLDPDPYRAYQGSGYQERIIAERVGGTPASW